MGFSHVVQAGLELLNSGDPPTSASQKMVSHFVAQAGFELLGSNNPPTLAYQSGLSLTPRLECGGTTTAHCSLNFPVIFQRWNLALWPRLERSGVISAHCNLPPPPGFKQFSCLSLPILSFDHFDRLHFDGQNHWTGAQTTRPRTTMTSIAPRLLLRFGPTGLRCGASSTAT
ncbi:hypothetical protein AAY473_015492 [Plecturocebus cupreus]